MVLLRSKRRLSPTSQANGGIAPSGLVDCVVRPKFVALESGRHVFVAVLDQPDAHTMPKKLRSGL